MRRCVADGTWRPMLEGFAGWPANGFRLHVAGRMLWHESETEIRAGSPACSRRRAYPIEADDPGSLVLFPEMDVTAEVPEITTRCWGILGKRPEQMMCASSRMVIKRKGAGRPVVVPCTLLPYDPQFEMGETLAEAKTTRQAEPSLLRPVLRARRCFLLGRLIGPARERTVRLCWTNAGHRTCLSQGGGTGLPPEPVECDGSDRDGRSPRTADLPMPRPRATLP